jgi:lysine 2,3-aminomutase
MDEKDPCSKEPGGRARREPWTSELAQGLSSTASLKRNGFCSPLSSGEMATIKAHFDVLIPKAFQIPPHDKQGIPEALRKQVEPTREELIFFPEELDDPIGDEAHSPLKGLTHRYPDRVLVKLTHLCGMYCRFCFRRYKVSQHGHQLQLHDLHNIASYLNEHPEIWEVVLTGGDPLILPDAVLRRALHILRSCPGIRVIRFHTRIPTALPSRITTELVQLLRGCAAPSEQFPHPCSIWVAAHINSSDELGPETQAALSRLVDAGIPVIGQSVLLKGVNDSRQALTALFRGLVACRVKPYYLHYPDLAKGTDHFRIDLQSAIDLFSGLRGALSGLCLPQFILDIPGGKGKIPLHTENLRQSFAPDGSLLWHALSPLTQEWVPIRYPHQQGGPGG